MFVDPYLIKHDPERFQEVLDSYTARLTAIEHELKMLEQVAA